jgi:hypothetical protein
MRHQRMRRFRMTHTNIETLRIQRTWIDMLALWRRAYQTRIFNERREVVGRGSSEQSSREAALTAWVTDAQREYEASRVNRSAAP